MCPFKYKATGLVIIKKCLKCKHFNGQRPIKRGHLTEFAVVSLDN